MERDFLGLGGRDMTRPSCCNDSAFLASSVVQRPNPKGTSSLQQLVSFKAAAREDGFDGNVFARCRSSGFHPLHSMGYVDATHRLAPALLSQSMDGRGNHLFPTPAHQSAISDSNGNTGTFPMASNQSIPMSHVGFSKSHASGTMQGSSAMPPRQQQQQPSGGRSKWVAAPVSRSAGAAFTPRNSTISVPATAQLTIFYGGAVNVYDNVPIDKVEAIMSFASNSSTASSSSGEPRKRAPPPPPLISGKRVEVESTNMSTIHQHTGAASPCSAFSGPMSVASHSGSGSSSHDDRERHRRGKADPAAKCEAARLSKTAAHLGVERIPGNTLTVRAVPMARKASVARFLEKRKERMTNATPYPTQKADECGARHGTNH